MRKMFKGTVAVLLAFMLMLSTIVPTLAAEQQTPDISQWAVGKLTEGERYGIFPMEWYFDSFRDEISKERLELLFELTDAKLASLNLTKKENVSPFAYKGSNTRGDIIKGLYDIVAQYDLPVGTSAVDYMKSRGIIKGTVNGLELDKAATTEQAVIFAIRFVQDTFYQVEAGAKGVAWKVEHNGNLVYLLGSIHVGSPNLYPFSEALLTAFHESDALLVEVNLFDDEGLQYYSDKLMYQDGKTLKDTVSAETYANVLKVLEMYELPAEVFTQFKPWGLASYLSSIAMSESLDIPADEMANLGIDMYFLLNAYLTQKPILELEGIKAQTDMFEGLSAEAQETYLKDVLSAFLQPQGDNATEAELLEEWFTHWIAGDIDAFKKSLLAVEGEPTEFDQMLLGARDVDMADKISQLLELEEKGTYFIVVGAAHFLAEESILYHLEKKGYKVEKFYK